MSASTRPAATSTNPKFHNKITVDVEVILTDGTHVPGAVFIGFGERILDLLNHPNPFFPVRTTDDEILLIAKSAVAVCKPLDQPN